MCTVSGIAGCFLLPVVRLPPSSTLFPYTTLFRSLRIRAEISHHAHRTDRQEDGERLPELPFEAGSLDLRSEEHTSELQSLTNLVCRLLLEKKNHQPDRATGTPGDRRRNRRPRR